MNRIVVFDLDDTLFPEWQFVLSGFRAVDDWLGNARKVEGFFEEAKQFHEEGSRGNVFDLALRKLGVEPGPEVVKEMVRVYREHKPRLDLFEDAKWAVNYFGARGPMGLLSDGYLATQQNKFAALNIADAFAAVVFSDALGRDCWKPSPEPYRRIMEIIPGAANEYVYVADNPRKDFVTARKLGWATIQIERKEGTYRDVKAQPGYEADVTIQSLFELENL